MPRSETKTPSKIDTKANIHIWNVPAKLHAKFKARCALDRLTMKDVIIRLITEFVERS